ncbi:MAG: hypothetical protein JJU40_09950 [Rhodobacteraceae bacterium]|nr:hypothetical protein [Paracoccaceae bacterium]
MEYIETGGRSLWLIIDINRDRILAVLIIVGALWLAGVLVDTSLPGMQRL